MRKLLLSTFALAVAFAASAFQLADRHSMIKAHEFNGQIEKQVTKKSHKAPAQKISSLDEIPGSYLCQYYDYFNDYATAYCDVTIEQGASDNEFIIKGLWGSWTKDLTATYDEETGKLIIPRQSFYEYEGDDPADFVNVEDTDSPVTATIYSDAILIEDAWGALITSGTGTGYYYAIGVNTLIWFETNGKMTMDSSDINIIIEQSNDTVYFGNFGGLGVDVYAVLAADSTFTIEPQLVGSSSNGDFYTTDISTWYFGAVQCGQFGNITGNGTETTLTSNLDGYGWTAGATTGYWYGQMGNFVISRLDDVAFVYPKDPAMYLAGSMTNWADGKEAMTLGEDGKFSITKEMDVNAEFKFINENDEWIGGDAEGNFIVQKEQVENGTELTMLVNAGNNFQIPVAGTWTLTVDPENMKLVISGEWNEPVEETHLYILGNVGDQGWDPSVGTEMQLTEAANEFEYTGTFNDNSYFSFTKKLAETSDDWDAIKAYRVGATTNDFEVDNLLGENIALGAWSSSSDNAFKITNGGEYTVTVNLNDMVVVFTKKAADLKKGDVTGEGTVDVADVNAIINIILELKTRDDYPGNADLTGEGMVDVADVNEVINIILGL